nr:triose-phosphate isomerase [Kordiimonas marina]
MPLVAGNWKMNGLRASQAELDALKHMIAEAPPQCEVLICPPFTLVGAFSAASGETIGIGGQDCHAKVSGAHTGDISAAMLKDCGAKYVIVGHSERRADHGETDDMVRAKAEAVLAEGLVAIVCAGEREDVRDAGKACEHVLSQLASSVPEGATPENTVIAYEPVWAIGTGRTPTTGNLEEMHGAIRAALVERFGAAGNGFRILYGGSVNAGNARDLMAVANVDGGLVGGASLKAADFNGIMDAYRG